MGTQRPRKYGLPGVAGLPFLGVFLLLPLPVFYLPASRVTGRSRGLATTSGLPPSKGAEIRPLLPLFRDSRLGVPGLVVAL